MLAKRLLRRMKCSRRWAGLLLISISFWGPSSTAPAGCAGGRGVASSRRRACLPSCPFVGAVHRFRRAHDRSSDPSRYNSLVGRVGSRPAHHTDRRRACRSWLWPPGCPTDRWLSHHHGRPDAARRRRRGCSVGLALGGRSVRGSLHRAPTAFAAAAAIAVRNLDLVRVLEARSGELAHKVDQLEALGEVGEAVSSSLDLDTVLSTIVMHAVQLSGTDGGSLMEFDESEQRFFVRTAYGTATKCWSTCGRQRSRCTTRSSAAPRWRGDRSQIPT